MVCPAMVQHCLDGGWPTPLIFFVGWVSWDDDIPNWMESHKIHVPNHQPVVLYRVNKFWLKEKTAPKDDVLIVDEATPFS